MELTEAQVLQLEQRDWNSLSQEQKRDVYDFYMNDNLSFGYATHPITDKDRQALEVLEPATDLIIGLRNVIIRTIDICMLT